MRFVDHECAHVPQGHAYGTMLNGVSVARRKRVKPAFGYYVAQACLARPRAKGETHLLTE